MLYNIGDILVCKNTVNAQCLEMTNPDFDIKAGDIYTVTDKDDYPNDNHCHWYELTSQKDKSIILNAWNDDEHMIIDDEFERIDGSIIEKELHKYKEQLKEKFSKHFANPYCAKTDIGNVMYEKEIMELIDRN